MKASTSSGLGGKPVRSNVARRISVRASARGEGASFDFSSLARTNESIRLCAQLVLFTSGNDCVLGGWNDQNFRPSTKLILALDGRGREESERGSGAHARIHITKSATTVSGTFSLGGIWRFSS